LSFVSLFSFFSPDRIFSILVDAVRRDVK
jgi:hypothetical protein